MKLAIAETGIPPHHLSDRFGRYTDKMVEMLAQSGLEAEIFAVPVHEGAPPPGPESADALLITGSPAGVYDGYDWIASLEVAIRDWAESGKPVVGICFGHQVMASAMGGRVEKSSRGWGVGVHTYELVAPTGLEDQPARISCVVSHQDQVVELPRSVIRLGGSAFCPYGLLQYTEGKMLSFQMHPEFGHDFAAALLDLRNDKVPPETRELAEASFPHQTDRALMGRWIASFLKGDI